MASSDPRRASRAHSLLWRVFMANAAIFALIVVLLAVTPVTITAPIIALDELLIVLAGFALILVVNLFVLRRVLAPLQELTETMQAIDPERPGRRVEGLTDSAPVIVAVRTALNSMLDRLERERRESARVAVAAQEGERQRVARELHDEIGQTLTAAAIQIEHAAGGDGSQEDLASVAKAVRASLDDVRRIARELRPEALDDLGLVNALIALCSRIGAQGDVRMERNLESVGRLPSEIELVIYRVAQESLTNVIRHAQATRAVITLTRREHEIVLSVQDDGQGLPATPPDGAAGINGMRERARLAGANLFINSKPGEGTTVRLGIPVDENGRAGPA
jgi:two-component system sensor histidine kinase UhpB